MRALNSGFVDSNNRYRNHLNYLKEWETHNVISKGFILKKSANIGHVSTSFKNDWDKILEDGSHRLQRILVDGTNVDTRAVTSPYRPPARATVFGIHGENV